MSKLRAAIAVAAASALTGVAVPCAAGAAVFGPHAAECATGSERPAMLVRISGLKARTGMIRVQSYGGDPEHYFDKGSYLERVEFPTPAAGPVEVCMVVPRPGTYAVSVRHDLDGSGSAGMADGGGISGNPKMSLMDVLAKRHPPADQVMVKVEKVTRVPIVMSYVQGFSFKPIATAER